MKRSSQVALLLMGATGMGAGAFALTPGDCVPATAPSVAGAPAAQPCSPRSTGSRYYTSHWSRPIFTRTSTTPSAAAPLSGRSSVPSVPHSTTTSSQRGGFGTTGHSISSSS